MCIAVTVEVCDSMILPFSNDTHLKWILGLTRVFLFVQET